MKQHLLGSFFLVQGALACRGVPDAASGTTPATAIVSETTALPEPPNDSELARSVASEERRLVDERGARRVDILAIEVGSRALLASAHFGPDDDVEIASTLKPLTVGAALDAGLDPELRFSGEGGRWTLGTTVIQDQHPETTLDAELTLVRSSNVGTAKIAESVGAPRVGAFLRQLGLGASIDATRWGSNEGLVLSTGIGFRGTPAVLAEAYATLAAGGVDGNGRRVLASAHAALVRRMLEAATREDGTGRRAQVVGVRVAGKTGTSLLDGGGYGTWFAGMLPADEPELVVVVYAEVPDGYGGSVAAPSFARIARAWRDQNPRRTTPAPVAAE